MRTTRILAEIDDETSGTESYYVSDRATGLPVTLSSDPESRDDEHKPGSPLLVEDDNRDYKRVAVDIPTAAGSAGIFVLTVSFCMRF